MEPASKAKLPADERRRRRRDWRLAALAFLVLAVLIAVEREVLPRAHSLPLASDTVLLALVHISVILIGLLVFLLARNVVKLFVDRRAGVFGSKLNTRFVTSFVFATALSSTALFVLSALLVSRAVNVWSPSCPTAWASRSVADATTRRPRRPRSRAGSPPARGAQPAAARRPRSAAQVRSEKQGE